MRVPSNAPRDAMPFRVLLTRSDMQAEEMVNSLSTVGIVCVSAPMLKIRDAMLPEKVVRDAAAFAFTSPNGVDAFVRQGGKLGTRTLFAVGPQTAQRLLVYGGQSIHAGAGDAASLLKVICSAWRPVDGKIVHISGQHVSSDIGAQLAQRGYQSSRCVAYSAVTATKISNSVLEGLRKNAFNGVIFLSRRAAQTFCTLLKQAGAMDAKGPTAFCLSNAISEAIEPGIFSKRRYAANPTRTALVDLLMSCQTIPQRFISSQSK